MGFMADIKPPQKRSPAKPAEKPIVDPEQVFIGFDSELGITFQDARQSTPAFSELPDQARR